MTTDVISEAKRLLKEGKSGEAINLLGPACQANPEDPEIHTYLGVAYGMEDNKLHAVYHFEQAVNLEESARNYYNLGAMYEKSRRIDEAVRQYRMALEMDKDYTKAAEALERIRQKYAVEHTDTEDRL